MSINSLIARGRKQLKVVRRTLLLVRARIAVQVFVAEAEDVRFASSHSQFISP